MSYKEEQSITRQAIKPKLVQPKDYNDREKEWIDKQTVYNRQYRRRREVDRTFTRKGYRFGKKI